MGPWHKPIGVLWKASQSLEINSFLGRRRLLIRAADPNIVRKTLEMTLHKAGLIKLGDDGLQEKDMIAMIPRKLRNMTANCEEPIA